MSPSNARATLVQAISHSRIKLYNYPPTHTHPHTLTHHTHTHTHTLSHHTHTHTQGRTNLSPDKVPWSALRTLLSQCIYGGRIDNEFDQRLLDSFVNRLFTVKSFETEFALMGDIDGKMGKSINMPDGIRWVWGETSVHTGCGGETRLCSNEQLVLAL